MKSQKQIREKERRNRKIQMMKTIHDLRIQLSVAENQNQILRKKNQILEDENFILRDDNQIFELLRAKTLQRDQGMAVKRAAIAYMNANNYNHDQKDFDQNYRKLVMSLEECSKDGLNIELQKPDEFEELPIELFYQIEEHIKSFKL